MNSFEQLCINLCNEKLQKLFVDVIFEGDKKLYKREGVYMIECPRLVLRLTCVGLMDVQLGEFQKNDDTVEMLAGNSRSAASFRKCLKEQGDYDNTTEEMDEVRHTACCACRLTEREIAEILEWLFHEAGQRAR